MNIRNPYSIVLIVVSFLLLAYVLVFSLRQSHDNELKIDCITTGGTVAEQANGTYDHCVIPSPHPNL